ncbi:MAG: M48 family metalloprotease [Candidatus Woesearchaeota archaeon]
MIIESAIAFATDPAKMLIVVILVLVSIAALLAWKKYSRPAFLYAHLFFVVAPLFYFALSINCSMSLMQDMLSWCTGLFAKFILYIMPPLMMMTFIAGYALLPYAYKRIAKPLSLSSFRKLCENTGIKAELYVLDKAKPVAFTLKNKIFVSVGMCELLSKKEIEAVLLHELYHVRSSASWGKFSGNFVRLFSPIAWFSSHSVESEEIAADAFTVKIQKTAKFIVSSKKKVSSF